MTFRSMALLPVSGLLVACFVFTEPVDSLELEVSVEPASFRIGDTAAVVVTLRNPTSDTVRYRDNGCPPHFAVYDVAGRRVSPAGIACPEFPFLVELAPGQERRFSYTWFGEPWENVRYQNMPYPAEFLPAGVYTVRAVVPLDSGERRSAAVAVHLLPRDGS